MNFPTCTLILAILAAAQACKVEVSDKKAQDVGKLIDKCLTEFPAPRVLLDMALYEQVYPSDSKVKAHTYCISKLINFLDEEGKVQVDLIRKKLKTQLPEKEIECVVKKCNIQRSCPQDTAYDSLGCYYDNLPTNVSIWSVCE